MINIIIGLLLIGLGISGIVFLIGIIAGNMCGETKSMTFDAIITIIIFGIFTLSWYFIVYQPLTL